jgi:hypothetical protein
MQSSKNDFLARRISEFLTPPFILIVVVSILLTTIFGPISDKVLWWIILVIGPAVLPVSFVVWLFKKGRVTGMHLPIRQERTVPYLFTLLCITVTILLLKATETPAILMVLMLAYWVNAFFLLVINLSWKISAHAVGVACPLVVLSWKLGILALPLFVLVPVVAWSRWQLRAHTFAEVFIGSVAGLVLTYIQLVYVLPMWGD